MQRLATFLFVLTVGGATLFAQGQPELPGTAPGKNRIDLERLHRIAERAKSHSQIDPSRAGSLSDVHRSRGSFAERLARRRRDRQPDLAQRFRERVRANMADGRRELSRDKIHSRFAHRADRNEPHRLALRQRLAQLDRMRDEALKRQDWEALARADRLERDFRQQFATPLANGFTFDPPVKASLDDGVDLPRLANRGRQPNNHPRLGMRPDRGMENNGNRGGQVGDGNIGVPGAGGGQGFPGTGGDGSPGSGGSGDGNHLNPLPPPPPPPPIWPPPPRKEYPRLPPEGGNWGWD